MENSKVVTNVIAEKSYGFAVRVVNLYKHLSEKKKEFVLSKQLLRSGTAIGALVHEAEHGQSKSDFLHKMNVALKEANETLYWLRLLHDTSFVTDAEYNSINDDAVELIKILISIVKTTKQTLQR